MTLDLAVAQPRLPLQEGWRFSPSVVGCQCVTTTPGALQNLEYFVANSDTVIVTPLLVRMTYSYNVAMTISCDHSVGRGSSSDNSLQYSFSCSGSESSISQCPYTFSYERQSTCSYIITLYCISCRLIHS
jgi:hypothetical protein